MDDDKYFTLKKAKTSLSKTFITDESQLDLISFESENFPKYDFEKNMHEYMEPRQFSLMQIRELFFSLLHISKFREDFWHH